MGLHWCAFLWNPRISCKSCWHRSPVVGIFVWLWLSEPWSFLSITWDVVFVVCCFGCTFCVCGCLFAFKQTAIHFLCSTSPEAHGVKCIYACQNTKNDWMANVTTVVEWFKHSIHPQSDVLLGFRDVMFYVSDLSNDFSKLLEGSWWVLVYFTSDDEHFDSGKRIRCACCRVMELLNHMSGGGWTMPVVCGTSSRMSSGHLRVLDPIA